MTRSVLRILVLNWRDVRNPEAGGSENHVFEVTRRWASLGHEVTLLCSSFDEAVPTEVVEGVRVIRLGNRYTVYFHAIRFLHRHPEFDAIFESINTFPFFSPVFSRVPVVALVYSIDNRTALLEELGLKLFPVFLAAFVASKLIPRLYRDSRVVTISESSKERLASLGMKHVSVAHPGVSGEWRLILLDAPQVNRPNHNIIFLGRLKKYKGVQHLLKAIPLVKTKIPDVMMFIVGRGDYETELRSLVTKLGIESNVSFCGYVSEREKARILKNSSLYVCLSSDEGGWTISAVEAMSAGLPLLVNSSQIDVLDGGRTGDLLDSNNPDEIAAKVSMLLLGQEKWKLYSAEAMDFSSSFTWDETSRATMAEIRDSIR